jgi:hypothetical protein
MRCVYSGPADEALPYFELGHSCFRNFNAAKSVGRLGVPNASSLLLLLLFLAAAAGAHLPAQLQPC